MAIIEKKIWPEYFAKVKRREKNVDLRLADFRVKKGDWFMLREWNPKEKRYTGQSLKRKVSQVYKFGLLKFHTLKELKKYGLYVIEMK